MLFTETRQLSTGFQRDYWILEITVFFGLQNIFMLFVLCCVRRIDTSLKRVSMTSVAKEISDSPNNRILIRTNTSQAIETLRYGNRQKIGGSDHSYYQTMIVVELYILNIAYYELISILVHGTRYLWTECHQKEQYKFRRTCTNVFYRLHNVVGENPPQRSSGTAQQPW